MDDANRTRLDEKAAGDAEAHRDHLTADEDEDLVKEEPSRIDSSSDGSWADDRDGFGGWGDKETWRGAF